MSSNRGNIYFEIQTNDPARAMGFCSEVFGWQFSAVKDLPIEYWRIAANRSEGGLLRRPAQNPAGPCGTNAFVCSFEVESYDLTEQKILRLGGTVALPKFPVRGRCWQGYYIDTEGKTFGVFEVDEEAGN
jgi:predicted enzyme related to lactoylglutathione lyase